VDDIERRIEGALEDMMEPLLLTEPDTPALRRRMERQARVILQRFVQAGEISHFALRLGNEEAITFHLGFRTPQRVREIQVRVAPRT
jgi:hypothetical protein